MAAEDGAFEIVKARDGMNETHGRVGLRATEKNSREGQKREREKYSKRIQERAKMMQSRRIKERVKETWRWWYWKRKGRADKVKFSGGSSDKEDGGEEMEDGKLGQVQQVRGKQRCKEKVRGPASKGLGEQGKEDQELEYEVQGEHGEEEKENQDQGHEKWDDHILEVQPTGPEKDGQEYGELNGQARDAQRKEDHAQMA
ncbi:hypothetical protein NDU88_003410 [Pleurodeles waltl]|uniref:Uncharacterized protein n=1 Tax=Pleurodeles waltl TaxID=8319 RepID=A0AAV7TR16_PLEWA|nr:hypothetical protein NDU88_003410 [Pleurodeles waltl]